MLVIYRFIVHTEKLHITEKSYFQSFKSLGENEKKLNFFLNPYQTFFFQPQLQTLLSERNLNLFLYWNFIEKIKSEGTKCSNAHVLPNNNWNFKWMMKTVSIIMIVCRIQRNDLQKKHISEQKEKNQFQRQATHDYHITSGRNTFILCWKIMNFDRLSFSVVVVSHPISKLVLCSLIGLLYYA